METLPAQDVTRLLAGVQAGDREAVKKILPFLYAELRRLARRHLRGERPGHTLQTTALVHEAYLKLMEQREVQWRSRAHFFAIAARLMRRILVDYARARDARKRGGGRERVAIEEASLMVEERGLDLIALDEALERLAAIDEQQSRIVELRFFAGLSVEEAAQVLGVSAATVKRDWNVARRWLKIAMEGTTGQA